MRNLETIHRQELEDILSSARLCLCDKKLQPEANTFPAAFGRLFCEIGADFGDAIQAYEGNKKHIPDVLANVAQELERRDSY